MSDENRSITDDMQLADLTVGEFKSLMQSILAAHTPAAQASAPDAHAISEPQVEVKRQSLDDFMNQLGGNK